MGSPASYPSKPDLSPDVRMALFQTVDCGKRITVHLEVFGLGVDRDVLLGVLFSVDLRTHEPLKNLIPALGKAFCVFSHDTMNRS